MWTQGEKGRVRQIVRLGLTYIHLENPVDRGAWRAIVHRVAELDTTEVT